MGLYSVVSLSIMKRVWQRVPFPQWGKFSALLPWNRISYITRSSLFRLGWVDSIISGSLYIIPAIQGFHTRLIYSIAWDSNSGSHVYRMNTLSHLTSPYFNQMWTHNYASISQCCIKTTSLFLRISPSKQNLHTHEAVTLPFLSFWPLLICNNFL